MPRWILDDVGKYLGVVAMYDGGHGSGKTVVLVSDNMVTAGGPLDRQVRRQWERRD